MDPSIFERQIAAESGFDPGAHSPAGAQGIAQFMPATARGLGINPLNPKQALHGAAKLMAGYVHQFGSYEKALQAYSESETPPDLIITDFAMHQMDGLDLIRECRRLHPRQKIILLSGTVDETIFAGTGVRPDRFLEKPYQPADLAEVVQDILAG